MRLLKAIAATAIIAMATFANIEINEINFPDPIFRNWIIEQPWNDGLVITDAEIAGVTRIGVYDINISDLTGIEHFPALVILDAVRNQLTSLDVSNNKELKLLMVVENRLTSLDISNNTELKVLSLSNNQLTSLDVSNNTALEYLSVNSNQITSLDVSNNAALEYLDVNWNQITSLDVSNNTELKTLSVFNNQLTSLDLSNNTLLLDATLYRPNIPGATHGFETVTMLEQLFVPLRFIGDGNGYHVAINLNNPTGLADGIAYDYANEILTSNSNTIYSSPFTVETGLDGRNLSGEFFFTYQTLVCEAPMPLADVTALVHNIEHAEELSVGIGYYYCNINNAYVEPSVFIPLESNGTHQIGNGNLSEWSNLEFRIFPKEGYVARVNGEIFEGGIYHLKLPVEPFPCISFPYPLPPLCFEDIVISFEPKGHIHDWGDWSAWTRIKDPTCTEQGTETRTRICLDCGHSETEIRIIPALPWGEWSDWTIIKAPTCTEEGTETRMRTCGGQSETQTRIIPPFDWSEWSDWITVKAPTCLEEGMEVRIRTCGGQTDTEAREIPQLSDGCLPGFLVFADNPSKDKAEISVIMPTDETLANLRIIILDALGNLVFEQESNDNSPDNPIIWNLTNRAGRLVASGKYLVIAQIISVKGNTYRYSAMLGVKR